jgi:hypothetical protein
MRLLLYAYCILGSGWAGYGRGGALFTRADAGEREVAAAATKQAVLAKAFRNELVQHKAEAFKA